MAGSLTISGLLYEGNYEEWIVRMDAVIVPHFGHPFSTKILPWLPWDEARAMTVAERREAISTFTRDVASIIRAHVRPGLLARLPQGDREGNRLFLTRLEALAKPFPFLRLPADVRARIYAYVLPRHKVRAMSKFPIIQVSSLVRKETLPLLVSRTKYSANLFRSEASDPNRVVQFARESAENILCDHRKQLRSFSLGLLRGVPNDDWAKLHFTFSNESGLQVTTNGLCAESKALVQKHVADVEANRKALGLQGESIILALVSKPELWVKGVLNN
ncbi:hypothetical protein LTR85_012184 [Meristemomyces frigidus]|nr:hypothetical protein LTR85_012184 [Meristemomyces frigidus]